MKSATDLKLERPIDVEVDPRLSRGVKDDHRGEKKTINFGQCMTITWYEIQI